MRDADLLQQAAVVAGSGVGQGSFTHGGVWPTEAGAPKGNVSHLIAAWAMQSQHERMPSVYTTFALQHMPLLPAPAFHTAMQAVWRVINGQVVLVSVQCELAIGNAICYTANHSAKVR